ncbi:MAG: helix-turn-helix domain-containing protein [Proteobacteria bacterium]|nr:helix-turn-helix domain-containing protein [Pseudomonadota bacterium]
MGAHRTADTVARTGWMIEGSSASSGCAFGFGSRFATVEAMVSHPGFHEWHHQSADGATSSIFPDGCRDVLVIRKPREAPSVVLTQLDLRVRTVGLAAGTKITGYRLRPGVVVDKAVLRAIAIEPEKARSILAEVVALPSDLEEVIGACTQSVGGLGAISGNLGVSVRTMQRLFRAAALPPPDFWRLLARARRAVGLLQSSASLADIASDCGYSDQAHMTRETLRWFQKSPARIRRDVHLHNLLSQPGLGNWTGEQISTR